MKKLSCLLAFFLNSTVHAAGTVDFLKIDKDIVLFSTTEAKTSSPVCVSTENADNWAVSLKSESGRAMYSLLVTAMAKELALEVDSAGDCADVEGFERASGLNLAPISPENSNGGATWAGYTNPVLGNIAVPTGKGLFFAASQMCSATYPGARAMLWDDYVNIINTYPNTFPVWFIDAVESSSHAIGKSDYNFLTKGTIIFKNGQISPFYNTKSGGLYSGDEYSEYAACSNWSSTSANHTGISLSTTGKFVATACSVAQRIACVK